VGRIAAVVIGIITAIGGFLDIGELVALPRAGGDYRFGLLWALLLGTIGAMAYAEMCGRVELVSKRTVFDLIRERLGLRLGLVALAGGLLLNVLTLVAEIAGMAYVLELVTGLGFLWFALPAAAGLLAFEVWGNWTLLENIPSLLGLAMLVVPFGLLFGTVDVPWGEVGRELVLPSVPKDDHVLYLTSAIAVLGAALTPYEWYFYSSGGREEGWTVRDMPINRITAIAGFGLGSFLAFGLMIGAAVLFYPRDLSPAHLGQTGLIAASGFGWWGIVLFLVGAFGCVLGAAVEVSLAMGQGVAQFFGWPWGSSQPPRTVRGFTTVYVVAVVVAVLILLAGVNPIKVTVVSLIFSAAALPLTLYPLMLVANDPVYMGDKTNGLLANTLGTVFLVLLTLAAVAALPLVVVTGGGG
jgi:Mn2+/Fe2+ NRAMP family transporter